MASLQRSIRNFSGGRNGGQHPANIADNEMVEIVNMYVDQDSLRPRRGTRRLSDAYVFGSYPADFDSDLGTTAVFQSLYSYRDPATDKFVFIVAAQDRFLKLIPIGIETQFILLTNDSRQHEPCFPYEGRDPIGPSITPRILKGRFRFVQVNGYWYAVAEDRSGLIRGNGSSWDKAGIAQPSTAPAISQGPVGIMTAANYTVVTTLYNSQTGDESEHSEVSNTLALGSGYQIVVDTGYSGWAADFYDTIRVWCSQPGQAGAWFLAAELTPPVGVVIINVTPNELVTRMDDTNDIPPECGLIDVAHFDSRLFVATEDYIRPSKYLQYETFDVDEEDIPVESENGHKLKGIYPHDGRLIAFKSNYIETFIPTGAGDYRPLPLSTTVGVRSKFAMRGADHTLIFYDGFVIRRSDSFGAPVDISQKIADILKLIPNSEKDNLTAQIFPRQHLYVVVVPQESGVSKTLAYNYRDGGWSTFEFADAPTFLAEGFDESGNVEIYATTASNRLVELIDDNSDSDAGTAISYSFVSKAFAADRPDDFIELEDVHVLTSNHGVTATLSTLRDLSTAAHDSVSAYLYSQYSALKWFALNTLGVLSNYIQVKFSYTGVLPKDFKITSLFLRALVRVGQGLARNGVE